MKTLGLAAALVPLCWVPGSAFAQLQWQEKQIERHLSLDDAQAVVDYPFVNAGKYPVKIASVTTSCGCTVAQADKALYAPGDKGRITATYTVPFLAESQQKAIWVDTDDPRQPRTTLQLNVDLPPLFKVVPASLSWKVNGDMSPKTLVVEFVPKKNLDIINLIWSVRDRHFDARWITVVPHRKYLFTVSPIGQLGAPVSETMSIGTLYPPGRPKMAVVALAVQKE